MEDSLSYLDDLLFLFNGHISGRLDNLSLSIKTTSQNSSANFKTGARLHLIVQFPVRNITNEPENSSVVVRQMEFIYCLRRNLISPHVS